MKEKQVEQICEERISELYREAFEIIKQAFKDPESLIDWATWLSIYAHEFSERFKLVGKREDVITNIHYMVSDINSIGIAWFKNDAEEIEKAIEDAHLAAFSDGFGMNVLMALSVSAWYKTNHGIEEIRSFVEPFIRLVDVALVFEKIDKIREESRIKAA